MKISNPSVGNVISGEDPVAIAIGDAAAAGAGGEVSDEAHRHAVLDTQFMRLLGAQLTEGTTSSTSAVTIASITGLTIPVDVPVLVVGSWRRSTGAVASIAFGVIVNATVVQEAVAQVDSLAQIATANAASSGAFAFILNSRNADYLRAGARFSGGGTGLGGDVAWHLQTADMPDAEITAIGIRGFTLSALNTIAIDDLRAYALPTT